jgi:endonuclease YncB( thermonuclease family)
VARAIEQLRSGTTVGYAALGLHGDEQGTAGQQVHDGDTVVVRATGKEPDEAVGNLSVRFLGVDTPEVSFTLPDRDFVSIGNQAWEDYLKDPLAEPFEEPLSRGLLEHLRTKLGPGAAKNHNSHAQAARAALQAEIEADMGALGRTAETYRFFLAFAFEVMDRYGRFLCYVNRNQPDADDPEPRPESYNDRLLKKGMASPFFVWPNVDPFLEADSVTEAVIGPGKASEKGQEGALGRARDWVRKARAEKLGIFDGNDPLRLQAFELRFLGRRTPPDRWVIDLSKEDDVLVRPQNYYAIENAEDRLFVPNEYVPLFVESGWRRQEESSDGL